MVLNVLLFLSFCFFLQEFETKVGDDISVTVINGLTMIRNMATGMQKMLQNKVKAVQVSMFDVDPGEGV